MEGNASSCSYTIVQGRWHGEVHAVAARYDWVEEGMSGGGGNERRRRE